MPPEHAKTGAVYLNGTVLTMEDDRPEAEAVAVQGNRILAVGSQEAVKSKAGKNARIVDLEGRTMIPGFYDAHGHFFFNGRRLLDSCDITSPPLGDAVCVADVVARLRAVAKTKPAGEWIVGECYDDTLLEEKRAPWRHELDAVSTVHPVICYHASYHVLAVNGLALKMAGYDENAPDPPGGRLQRYPGTRRPNGVLEEPSAMLKILDLLPKIDDAKINAIVKTASHEYARNGVTTAQDDWVGHEIADYLALADRKETLGVRVVMFPEASLALKLERERRSLLPQGAQKLKRGHAKLFADGSIQCFTAHLRKPYHTPFQGNADHRGYPTESRESLDAKVLALHRAGYPVAVHGNGDQAIESILDAFESALRDRPLEDNRFQVIHAQTASLDQLKRMKRIGATPSFFSAHCFYWGDRHLEIFLGKERAERINPAGSASRLNLRFSIHCDAPVVPVNPLRLVWCAVNRITHKGRILGENERISVSRALKATTLDAAWQCFEEKERGSIKAGKFADFALLSDNPLRIPGKIHEIEVLETILEGETIFKKTADSKKSPS